MDNRGPEINIANAVNIKLLLHHMASIKIIIILKNDSLGTDRGRGLRELVAILRDLFGQHDNIKMCASSILLGVTNVNPKHVEKDEETNE